MIKFMKAKMLLFDLRRYCPDPLVSETFFQIRNHHDGFGSGLCYEKISAFMLQIVFWTFRAKIF